MTADDWAVLIIRISIGLSMVAHGLNKVRGPAGLQGTAGWFSSIGMRSPLVQARLAAGTEVVAGLSFTVGLVTPLAAAAIIGLMVVAVATVHWRVGYFIFLPNGGWEYCGMIIATVAAVALAGPGRASIDETLGIARGGAAGIAAVLVGLLGATIHLAVSYRPRSVGD